MGSLEQTNQKFQNDNWHDDKLTNQLRDTIALNKDDTFWWHFWQSKLNSWLAPPLRFLFFQRKIENLKVTKLGMEIVLIAKKWGGRVIFAHPNSDGCV